MQNVKIFKVMFSSIQNAEFIAFMKAFCGFFGIFWSTKAYHIICSLYIYAHVETNKIRFYDFLIYYDFSKI